MLSAPNDSPDKTRRCNELESLFRQHAERLKRSIRVHIDPRLAGRVDPSDVVQDVFLEAASRYADYQRQPTMPPFLWLRFLTIQRLALVHRTNFRVKARDIRREQRLAKPGSATASIAALLAGRGSSPSDAARREERRERVQRSLQEVDPIDREVLLLRHFEQLTNQETAQVLGLSETTASKRYIRALTRMKKLLAEATGSEA
jgi:RNA polymerase sigma-70 factor (ECF subfamily)